MTPRVKTFGAFFCKFFQPPRVAACGNLNY